MSSSRTLLRKLRTSFTCIKPRFDPSIILLYIAASVEQYCDITQVNALPQNEGILEALSSKCAALPAEWRISRGALCRRRFPNQCLEGHQPTSWRRTA